MRFANPADPFVDSWESGFVFYWIILWFTFRRKQNRSIVFLQTDNWRISFEGGGYFVHEIFDSNLKPINYRRLNYYPEFVTRSRTICENTEFTEGNETRQVDCKTPKGQDMSNDITQGLQITYYFR